MQHQLEGPNLCTSYAQLKESFFKVHAEVVDSVESKWRKEAIEFDRLHRRVVSFLVKVWSWRSPNKVIPCRLFHEALGCLLGHSSDHHYHRKVQMISMISDRLEF